MHFDAAPDFDATPSGPSWSSRTGAPVPHTRRVVLTGLGIVTGNAGDVDSFRRTLTDGASALGPLETGPARDWAYAFGAQVDDAQFAQARDAVGGSRDFGLALHAADQAVKASGLAAPVRVSLAR